MNIIVRDCGEIWARLFDHRPFTGGEVIYFQEEFETKRGEREITSLFQVLESLTDIKDSQTDKIESSCNTNLPDLQTKLDKALSGCAAILESEHKYDIDTNLEAKRQIRQCEWENFETETDAKRSDIDSKFDEKEKELLQFYKDLEKKLHIEDTAKSD